jgi:hypothetical protein
VHLVFGHSLVNGVLDFSSVMIVAQMVQHIHRSVQHGDGIRSVLPSDHYTLVPRPWFENCKRLAIILTRPESRSAAYAANHVRHDGSVKIWREQNVKLLRFGHQLHATIVDDDVVVFYVGIVSRNLFGNLQKQTVGQFHNVGLVDCRNLLALVLLRVLEGVPRHSHSVLFGDDLQILDDLPGDAVLQHGVLAFGVLPDYDDVDAGVFGRDSRIRLADHDVDVQVQFVSDRYISQFDSSVGASCLDVALDSHTVAFYRDEAVVQLLVVVALGVDLDDFKVYRSSDNVENLCHVVHQFWTYTNPWNHGDGVSSTVQGQGHGRRLDASWGLVLNLEVGQERIRSTKSFPKK